MFTKLLTKMTMGLTVALLCSSQLALAEAKKLKVALILSGPANDQGWNAVALDGLKKAEAKYGIETTYAENVSVADSEGAFMDYAAQGYDLVIGHGFQFQEPIIKVAQDFPKVNFGIGTGFKLAANVDVYDTKLEQGGYMMGIIAG
jgi:basic membrane protein A and related proteins